MLLHFRTNTDPYFNVAAEEYFVKTAKHDMCMLWINEKSVIIGKHQNTYNEINYPFIKERNIPVIRRVSGGGTVYHDLGNLNFSFILHKKKGKMPDFNAFTNIIIAYMHSLGLKTEIGERNSIYSNGKKISGHAEHIYKDKILHHGTILFNSDLKTLDECIKPYKTYKSKSLASVRSEVANIAELLPQFKDIHDFATDFLQYLKKYFNKKRTKNIAKKEIEKIMALAEHKYKTWNWNYAYSPTYSFPIQLPCNKNVVEISVSNGIIENVIPEEEINKECNAILENLIGVTHEEQAIYRFAVLHEKHLQQIKLEINNFSKLFF